MVRRVALACLMSLIAAAALAAGKGASPEAQLFGSRLRHGVSLELFLKSLETDFRQQAKDGGDVLRPGEVGDYEMMMIAMQRAKGAAGIMDKDLDGDGFLTEEEVRKALLFRQGLLGGSPALDARREERVKEYMAVDRNGDGRIDWMEAARQAAEVEQEERAKKGDNKKRDLMLALPAAADGELTLPEYQTAGEAVFRSADTDGDGRLSRAETDAYDPDAPVSEEARRTAEERAPQRAASETQPTGVDAALAGAEAAACAMPAASEKAEVVLVGVYDAEALSSVAIGTQDKTVQSAAMTITEGEAPLYIVAISHTPVIWRLTGAVDRVERLVIATNIGLSVGDVRTTVPLAGETGVQADRVTFLAKTDCMAYFQETPSVAAAKAGALVRAKAGKQPASVFSTYKVGEIFLPSGTFRSLGEKNTSGFPTLVFPGGDTLRIERRDGSMTISTGRDSPAGKLARFLPGGVADIDAKTVVATLTPVPYQVLPQEAGLVQLLQSGVLSRNELGEYLIHEKTRYPAGLCGGHSTTFLLLRGVPEPDGSPCHSRVYSEETGLLLHGTE